MFFVFGRAPKSRPTREHYEQDAAKVLAERMAEGRPPPEVWKTAVERRARKGQPTTWYPPTAGDVGPLRGSGPAGPESSSPSERRDPVAIGDQFLLRTVRLPVLATPSPSTTGEPGPRVVKIRD